MLNKWVFFAYFDPKHRSRFLNMQKNAKTPPDKEFFERVDVDVPIFLNRLHHCREEGNFLIFRMIEWKWTAKGRRGCEKQCFENNFFEMVN